MSDNRSLYDGARSLGDAVAMALDKLSALGLPASRSTESHVILWELAKWQGRRSSHEVRIQFADEIADLARKTD